MKDLFKNMSKTTKNNTITYSIVVIAYLIVQLFVMTGSISSLMKGLLVPICVYVIAAISLNLVVGISGELSLGHAGFMCVGAYSSAFFSCLVGDAMPEAIRFILAILVGAAVAAIFGILIGIPVLKLRGDYLAIVTLAFGEIIKNLMNILYVGRDSKGRHFSVTDTAGLGMEEGGQVIVKGALGITGTPKNSSFTVGVILILFSIFIGVSFSETTVVFICSFTVIVSLVYLIKFLKKHNPFIIYAKGFRGENIKEHEYVTGGTRIYRYGGIRYRYNPQRHKGDVYIRLENGEVVVVSHLPKKHLDIFEIGDTLVCYPGTRYPVVEDSEAKEMPCPLCGFVNQRGYENCDSCGLKIMKNAK